MVGSRYARVSGLQALLGIALAEVVGSGVDDDRSTDDRVRSDQGQVGVCPGEASQSALRQTIGRLQGGLTLELDLGDTGTISLDVAQVTDVPLLVGPVSVSDPVGVEVRSSRDASVGVVTELAVKKRIGGKRRYRMSI
jgi:hypothetical protein